MCSLLLDQFNSVFTSAKPQMIVRDPVSFFSCQSIIHPDDYVTDIEIDETIIIDDINELFSTSTAGPNGIPSLLLINCAAELAPALRLLFTHSLPHGFILATFKRATITLVLKSGIKTSPSNYRPISLTSTIIHFPAKVTAYYCLLPSYIFKIHLVSNLARRLKGVCVPCLQSYIQG